MKRNTPAIITAAVLACALGGIIGTKVLEMRAERAQPTALDLLGAPQSAEQEQLYARSAGQDVLTAHEYLKGVGIHSRPFTRENKVDGDTVDIYKRPDLTSEFSLEWFAAPAGQAQRLKVATLYAKDGKTVVAQVVFRTDGTRATRVLLQVADTYQTTTYFGDGLTRAEVKVVGPAPNSYDDTKRLLSDARWRPNGSVAYSNVLDAKLTRTIVEMDGNGHPLKTSVLTNAMDGSSVVAYYPGTTQVRLSATSTYDTTTANYYRHDGTLEKTAVITAGSVDVTFFDATGKVSTLKQTWQFTTVVTDDIGYATKLRIMVVQELDAKAKPTREWQWKVDGTGLWLYREFNVSVQSPKPGDPPVLCKRVEYFYGPDGTLQRVDYLPADPKLKDWSKDHEPAEGIKPPALPPADLADPHLDPDLPVPQGYGWE